MLDFLRSHRPQDTKWDNEHSISPVQKALTYKDMVSLAYQTARGMEYIASKNVSFHVFSIVLFLFLKYT